MECDAARRRGHNTNVTESFVSGPLDQRRIVLARNAGGDNANRVAENGYGRGNQQDQRLHGPALYEEIVV